MHITMNNLLLFILASVLLIRYGLNPGGEPSGNSVASYAHETLSGNRVSEADTFTSLDANELFGVADSIIENEGYENVF
jgi:hypothetical protein